MRDTNVVLASCLAKNQRWRHPSLILSTNAADVVRWLNALSSMDMRSIASDDVLTSLVTDYFVRSQIDNTDDDSESDSSDGDVDTDIDPPVVDIVAGEVNNDVTLTAPTALMVLACL